MKPTPQKTKIGKGGPKKGVRKLTQGSQGNKPTRAMTKLAKGKSPNATVKRKTHSKTAHALAGSGERIMMCRRLAFEHRMDGLTLRESAMKIADDMNLESIPSEPTVHTWIMSATSNIVGEMTELAKEWLPVLIGRLEKINHRFFRMALGGIHVERQIKQDGMDITIIDEKAFNEQIKAADLIRKNIETASKLLGIGNAKEGSDDLPGGLRGIQMALIQKHETHIHMPGQALPAGEGVILTMESGDPELDKLDAHQV